MKIDLGPVSRIEGHLNVRTTVENGTVVDAQCMGEMFRGFEVFLKGRDPLDAQQITQRTYAESAPMPMQSLLPMPRKMPIA